MTWGHLMMQKSLLAGNQILTIMDLKVISHGIPLLITPFDSVHQLPIMLSNPVK